MIVVPSQSYLLYKAFQEGLLSGLENAFKEHLLNLQAQQAVEKYKKQLELQRQAEQEQIRQRLSLFDQMNRAPFIDKRPVLNPDRYGLTAGNETATMLETETPTYEGRGVGLLSSVPQTYGAYLDLTQDWRGALDKIYGDYLPLARLQFATKGVLPPPPKPEKPKLKYINTLDVGDKKILVGVYDNGEMVVPAEFYKQLSPKEREELKLRKKELGIKVRRVKDDEEWKQYLKDYNDKKLALQREQLGLQRERLNLQKQKSLQEKPLTPEEAQRKAKQILSTRFRITTDIDGTPKIYDLFTGRQIAPQEYEALFNSVVKKLLSGELPRVQEESENANPDVVKPWLSKWGIE